MRKSTLTIIIIISVAVIAAGMYWFFFYNKTVTPVTPVAGDQGFTTINRNPPTSKGATSTTTSTTTTGITKTSTTTSQYGTKMRLPKLRQLSTTPVAGMFASTTKIKSSALASTTIDETIVRFIDRGAGHIFQANDLNLDIEKISNTTLPKIYEGYWNKNLTAMVLRYLKDDTDYVTNFYAELRKPATSTNLSTTQYEIKGKYLLQSIDQVVVSPLGDKIFTWNIDGGNGVGYLSSFDDKSKVKLIDTPLTQMNIDWQDPLNVSMTTKGSGLSSGYSYLVNTKTGSITKFLSGIKGLSAKYSKDSKNIIYSSGGSTIKTSVLGTQNSTSTEVIFGTIVDKCVWSSLRKNEVYCAVPNEIPEGLYPDDWYKGKVSFVDKIWHLDTVTGEVHLIANLSLLSKDLIDATQLTLDPKENYLYFINKQDLTLWSLDLNQ